MPDFQGDIEAVRTIAASGLDVYAHNVETVRHFIKNPLRVCPGRVRCCSCGCSSYTGSAII